MNDDSATAHPARDLVLRADDVVVDRGGARVLDRVSLAVAPGEVVAVQGPSGSGKTTLLAVLCGLVTPSSGSVTIRGRDLGAASDAARSAVRLRHFGVVFQRDELLPELTLGENVTLPLRLVHGRVSGSDAARVAGLADRLGIGSLTERLPTEVSGGQLQRAAIARALAHGPTIVLADEPTATLDRQSATSAMSSLVGVAREHGAALVVVTHDDEVAGRCDRLLVLRDGRLRDAGIREP